MVRLVGLIALGVVIGAFALADADSAPPQRTFLCQPDANNVPFVAPNELCQSSLIQVPITYTEGRARRVRAVNLASCGHGARGTCELAVSHTWQPAGPLTAQAMAASEIQLAPIASPSGDLLIQQLQEWITTAAINLQALEFAWRLYIPNATNPLFTLPSSDAQGVQYGDCAQRPIGVIQVRSDQTEALTVEIQSACRPNATHGLFTEHLELIGTKTWTFIASDRLFQWELGDVEGLRTFRFRDEAWLTVSLFGFDDHGKSVALYSVPMAVAVSPAPPTATPARAITEVSEKEQTTPKEHQGGGWRWMIAVPLALLAAGAAAWVRWGRRATMTPQGGEGRDGEDRGMPKSRSTAEKVEGETARTATKSPETSAKESLVGLSRVESFSADRELVTKWAREAFQDVINRTNTVYNQHIELAQEVRDFATGVRAQIETATGRAIEDIAQKLAASQLEQWKAYVEHELQEEPLSPSADRSAHRWVVAPEAKRTADAFMMLCRFAIDLHQQWVTGAGCALRSRLEAAWTARSGSEDIAQYQPIREEHMTALRGLEAVLFVDFPLAIAVQRALRGDVSTNDLMFVSFARQVWPHDWSDPEDVRRFARDWVNRRVPSLQMIIEALPVELGCLEPGAAGLQPALAALASQKGYGDHAAIRGSRNQYPGAGEVVSGLFHAHVTALMETADTEYSAVRIHQDGLQSKAVSALQRRRGAAGSLEYDHTTMLIKLGVKAGHGTIVRVTQPSLRYRPGSGGAWEAEGTILYLRVPHVAA